MPDRAVVDDTTKKPEHWKYVIKGRTLFDLHDMYGRGMIHFVVDPDLTSGIEVIKGFPRSDSDRPPVDSTPRALVALSEDRQWLVVNDERAAQWLFLLKSGWDYHFYQPLDDTGQDAREVLADFLASRQP